MIDSSDFSVYSQRSFMEALKVHPAELGALPARVPEQFYLVFYKGEFMRAFPSRQDAEQFIASLVEELNTLAAESREIVGKTFQHSYSLAEQEWNGQAREDLSRAQKAILEILELELSRSDNSEEPGGGFPGP